MDVHILDSNQVVMHIPVPDSDNAVGANWRTCIVESKHNTTRLDDGEDDGWRITADEKALVESGAVIEVSTVINIAQLGSSLAERNAKLMAIVAIRQAAAVKKLQARYQYFGHTGSIA